MIQWTFIISYHMRKFCRILIVCECVCFFAFSVAIMHALVALESRRLIRYVYNIKECVKLTRIIPSFRLISVECTTKMISCVYNIQYTIHCIHILLRWFVRLLVDIKSICIWMQFYTLIQWKSYNTFPSLYRNEFCIVYAGRLLSKCRGAKDFDHSNTQHYVCILECNDFHILWYTDQHSARVSDFPLNLSDILCRELC